jgi:hypothetical protein
MIVMWGGLAQDIPAGWRLCDGANGTPDLRDRFVKGATVAGVAGGSATHQHAAHTGVITHTHPVSDPTHAHDQRRHNATTGVGSGITTAPDTSSTTPVSMGPTTASVATGVAVSEPVGGVASLTHSAVSHEPAFYTLCFIQKV